MYRSALHRIASRILGGGGDLITKMIWVGRLGLAMVMNRWVVMDGNR